MVWFGYISLRSSGVGGHFCRCQSDTHAVMSRKRETALCISLCSTTSFDMFSNLLVQVRGHGGIWRTMHCRLCINCSGTGIATLALRHPAPPPHTHNNHQSRGSVTNNAKTTVHCSPDSSVVKGLQVSSPWLSIKGHLYQLRSFG
jgi:hypothetical protein